jgi:tetratricopeptide (TPR) repeat protein
MTIAQVAGGRRRETVRAMKLAERFFCGFTMFLLYMVAPSWARDRVFLKARPGQSAARSDPKAAFEKGQASLQAGDLAGAESAFREVLAADPSSGAAYANLGVIAMRRKMWDEALKNLRKAEKLAPQMAGVRLNIGLVEFRRGNYQQAIAPLQSVVREQPDSDQARYLIGLCQMFTNQHAEAVQTLEPMWDRMSNNVMYLYVMSISAHQAGRKETDEKATRQLIAVGGNSPELHLILGKAYFQHTQYDEALAELQRAFAAEPNLPFLHFNLGVTYARLERDVQAEEEFRKDIAIDPDLADNYYQLGLLYARQQKAAEAEKAFREALNRDPNRSGAWFGLARIYQSQENYPQALKAVSESIRLVPDSNKTHFLRGQILQKLGRQDEARAEFATAKKLMDASLHKNREEMDEYMLPNPELKQEPQ